MDTSRILVGGSSAGTEAHLALARALGRRIIEDTQHTVITGGLAGRADGGIAVDCAFAAAAESACRSRGDDVRQRIMTMLPAHDSRSLRRCEHGDVRRVEFADPRSRRYAMVLAADAVISIGGGIGTDSILELAWIAEKVMIPIRSSGGASAECWEKYGSHLKRRLRIRDDELNAIEADTSTLDDITNACLSILERHLRPRCFVAMAFGDKHPVSSAWEMYEAVLADRGFNPTRIDKQAVLGSVIQAISPDG